MRNTPFILTTIAIALAIGASNCAKPVLTTAKASVAPVSNCNPTFYEQLGIIGESVTAYGKEVLKEVNKICPSLKETCCSLATVQKLQSLFEVARVKVDADLVLLDNTAQAFQKKEKTIKTLFSKNAKVLEARMGKKSSDVRQKALKAVRETLISNQDKFRSGMSKTLQFFSGFACEACSKNFSESPATLKASHIKAMLQNYRELVPIEDLLNNLQYVEASFNIANGSAQDSVSDFKSKTDERLKLVDRCTKAGEKAVTDAQCLALLKDYGFFTHSNVVANISGLISEASAIVRRFGGEVAATIVTEAKPVHAAKAKSEPVTVDAGLEKVEEKTVQSAGLPETIPVEEEIVTETQAPVKTVEVSEKTKTAQPTDTTAAPAVNTEAVIAEIKKEIIADTDKKIEKLAEIVTENVTAAVEAKVEATVVAQEENLAENIQNVVAAEVQAQVTAVVENNEVNLGNNSRLLPGSESAAVTKIETDAQKTETAEVQPTTQTETAQAETTQAETAQTETKTETEAQQPKGQDITFTHVVTETDNSIGAAGNVRVGENKVVEAAAVANEHGAAFDLEVPEKTVEFGKKFINGLTVADNIDTNTDGNKNIPTDNTDTDSNNDSDKNVVPQKSSAFAFYDVPETVENSASTMPVNQKKGVDMSSNSMDKKFWELKTKSKTASSGNTMYWIIGGVIVLAAIAAAVFYYLRG